ncbi:MULTISPECIES: hypothetical protein [Cyanophyceae]|uniref:hypothetical protein n=1 Tax=Cyanophyceae TaxID=3028117 RepID=UPI00168937C2|nr:MULTISPECIES: hypothetical protein [Cyanophyceae]MBD1917178.1 hypothetical protein [Phormidium sp. FACHB-77]MBD2030709.1 hypothetical protein [Phormidium sp. FACHB-322]MBD2050183.1 hypothetical protein [Leptolyngbya sp. FACHB-60]
MTTSISIPTPEFELRADVWLRYGGTMIPTSIKVRHYDPDKGGWFYRVALSGNWHTADELEHRTGEAA